MHGSLRQIRTTPSRGAHFQKSPTGSRESLCVLNNVWHCADQRRSSLSTDGAAESDRSGDQVRGPLEKKSSRLNCRQKNDTEPRRYPRRQCRCRRLRDCPNAANHADLFAVKRVGDGNKTSNHYPLHQHRTARRITETMVEQAAMNKTLLARTSTPRSQSVHVRAVSRVRQLNMTTDPMTRRAQEAWGEYVVHYAPWTWFVGLTFASDISEASAKKAFRAWLRRLARDVVKFHFRYAVSWGPQESGRLHFHVVVALPAGLQLDPAWARQAWLDLPFPTQTAFAEWYDPGRAGAHYMANGHAETRIEIACPRIGDCAHRTCRLSPGGRF